MPRTFKDHALKWLIGILTTALLAAGGTLWAHEARISVIEANAKVTAERDSEWRKETTELLRDIQKRLPPTATK